MDDTRYAMVLAAFGTTCVQEEKLILPIQKMLQQQRPDVDIFVAFTSPFVTADKLEKGQTSKSLTQTLMTLPACGYTHVAVQSLHVVPGLEFDAVCDTTRHFAQTANTIQRVCTGYPLIHNDASVKRLARELADDLPPERQPGEAVVFVGHGTKHASGALLYPALQGYLWQHDPSLFVGTLEGNLNTHAILAMLRIQGLRKVWLVPLLACCGAHARQDIFGEKYSWQNSIEEGGLNGIPVEKALLERPGVAAMWVENAMVCLKNLE